MSALHQNLCHWDHNPNLSILIPVTHLDCVSSVFPLDYGSHAILWIVFLVSTLDSVYIPSRQARGGARARLQAPPRRSVVPEQRVPLVPRNVMWSLPQCLSRSED